MKTFKYTQASITINKKKEKKRKKIERKVYKVTEQRKKHPDELDKKYYVCEI